MKEAIELGSLICGIGWIVIGAVVVSLCCLSSKINRGTKFDG